MIRIILSEDVALFANGVPVELPKSRKARALLAYLAVEGRWIHRLRLCEMFWDTAADPRGGLRWALTRLKKALGRMATGWKPIASAYASRFRKARFR